MLSGLTLLVWHPLRHRLIFIGDIVFLEQPNLFERPRHTLMIEVLQIHFAVVVDESDLRRKRLIGR